MNKCETIYTVCKNQINTTSVILHPLLQAKPNKCNNCDFASAQAGNLRTHLIKHSGVKLHKCNQCDFTSYRKRNMTTHLETHNWEKLYKCTVEKRQTNAASAIMHLLGQVI